MESRREFFRKAGVAGGLGAAGALTLKKEYVRPVVRLLEPGAAYAQTPALTVGEAAWTEPVMDFSAPTTPSSNTLVIVVDLPGGSAPIVGSTFNAHLSLTPLSESGSGWATMSNIAVGATVESDSLANIGRAGPGGAVQFALRWQVPQIFNYTAFDMLPSATVTFPFRLTLNGVCVPPDSMPPELGSLRLGFWYFVGYGRRGDALSLCVHVFANQGSTEHGMIFGPHFVTTQCFQGFHSDMVDMMVEI